MNDHPFSRRRFLRQTSLGASGLVLTSSFLRAADGAGANQAPAVARQGKSLAHGNGSFEPVHYRPIPAKIFGLGKRNTLALDGTWRIDPKPGPSIREQPLAAANWANFQVPGHWMLQGHDIPRDQVSAVAREFAIPAAWAGYRILLRFDAIHGGTHYWLNGTPLGYSENLFTPVEWEITHCAKIGRRNRLDLEMKVATASERLSNSSNYVGYSLGGIDRSVKIYALPKLHVSRLHLNAGLDPEYRDGDLQITLGFDNPESTPATGFAVAIRLFEAGGKAVAHSNPKVVLDPLTAGMSTATISSRVPNPLKWNAEQPNLYRLVLTLEKDGQAVEQIERQIGFRSVETKERQLFVNGVRVKLAGVCHHEVDPLTGRAGTGGHADDDVKLFKQANLNLVRTSHYPCTQEFLDAADRHGLYVESEAPFCWVAPAKDLTDLPAVLGPTSAMIDYQHSHPCILIWSLANESHWSGLFDHSDRLCRQLDATRPTTLEHIFTNEDKATCGIISRHYQTLPYDELLKNDARPFLHGECYFLVYHERTDVNINPGLRELWASGNADPASNWGKSCLENLKGVNGLIPGVYPGAWSYIVASRHCIGSEIWSGIDDIAFLPDGKVVSSENGNAYWGLVDGWRRPKPELALARFVFAPVWFPVRQLEYQPGQAVIRVPVENRHSFTDLSQLEFIWEINGVTGWTRVSVPPAARGEFEIPIRKSTPEGATMLLRVLNGLTEVVNATFTLGERKPAALPQPSAGAPKWSDDGRFITIEGRAFSLVLDRTTGDFDATNPRHLAPITTFPALHLTRHDYGDLDRKKPAYAQLPDAKTRVVESVTVAVVGDGLELAVKDRYDHFAGIVRWIIDQDGAGQVSYDYRYAGDNLDSRELGIKAFLPGHCDQLKWRRWSEWGIFPDDCICRTDGAARARRDKKWPEQPANVKPAWPWSQDQNGLGTADFRSVKFCIFEASLLTPDGSGARVEANADAHFRACLADQGIAMFVLSQCPLAPVGLTNGARLRGAFSLRLLT